MQDFSKYELLKSSGSSPPSVYLAAKDDGHDQVSCIRILRAIFGLTLKEAKKIGFEAETGKTFESQERSLVDGFVRVLDEEFGSDPNQPRGKE